MSKIDHKTLRLSMNGQVRWEIWRVMLAFLAQIPLCRGRLE
jgi:hypothetical protein